MKSEAERCAEYEKFKKIDAAFRAGDLAALRAAVDDPASVPNGPMPLTIGSCLEYAIYHSPLPFIRTLLEIGADPNPAGHAGFPPLIAAVSCSRPRPGSPGRPDVREILQLLLAFKSDPNQRGINDYTPLHMAVSEHDLRAVDLLLQAGAAPCLQTRIDNCETPREMAEGGTSRDCRNARCEGGAIGIVRAPQALCTTTSRPSTSSSSIVSGFSPL
jgi:ankyrin repeat protein